METGNGSRRGLHGESFDQDAEKLDSRLSSALRTTHVILPAYNEEQSLPPLLSRLSSFSESNRLQMIVWIVDDGSTDGTGDVAARGSEGLSVKLVTHPRNLGLGQALHSGLREMLRVAATDDVAVVMDADDTHDVNLIMLMLERIDQGADLVVGSRFVEGGDDSTAPPLRRFLSRGAAKLFRTALPVAGIRDFTSGYRAYRTDLLRRATSHWGERIIEERGFACMVELLLKLRWCNPTISEVPLALRYDRKQGASKLKILRTIVQYIRLAFRDRLSPPPYRQL